mmetsp:Transcript_28733/g.72769  ORF Transcript_28733/g.72769 Transcript_28733/m.72769 type:complete len:361 (+) Transcript_28733:121-1203(+)|eukprot:CAMPEP_0178991442 /NCGR_PEP_ID=MMETSP0795-20121207/5529_1 /TAXON_ID=88552 /ORGANISM="Amoebophrya sp., Strain Ameob2" /LENGTH=360 /DNA_ID=CAMNT_0020683149 /DNA_START=97 /DNA_END=1179 /DNA_ORIENTATION=+
MRSLPLPIRRVVAGAGACASTTIWSCNTPSQHLLLLASAKEDASRRKSGASVFQQEEVVEADGNVGTSASASAVRGRKTATTTAEHVESGEQVGDSAAGQHSSAPSSAAHDTLEQELLADKEPRTFREKKARQQARRARAVAGGVLEVDQNKETLEALAGAGDVMLKSASFVVEKLGTAEAEDSAKGDSAEGKAQEQGGEEDKKNEKDQNSDKNKKYWEKIPKETYERAKAKMLAACPELGGDDYDPSKRTPTAMEKRLGILPGDCRVKVYHSTWWVEELIHWSCVTLVAIVIFALVIAIVYYRRAETMDHSDGDSDSEQEAPMTNARSLRDAYLDWKPPVETPPGEIEMDDHGAGSAGN